MYLFLLEFYRVLPYCLFQLSSAPADSIDFDILIMNSVSFANIGACHDPYGFLPNYRGFYWFLLDFTGFYCFFLLLFIVLFWAELGFRVVFFGFLRCSNRVLLGFTDFLLCPHVYYRALPGFTGFYWILLGFYRVFIGFYLFLMVFTGLYCVSLVFTGFYWVLQAFTGFNWVFLCFY